MVIGASAWVGDGTIREGLWEVCVIEEPGLIDCQTSEARSKCIVKSKYWTYWQEAILEVIECVLKLVQNVKIYIYIWKVYAYCDDCSLGDK